MNHAKMFEDDVMRMYRSLGYSVADQPTGSDQGFDFVLQTTLPGIGKQIVYVECKSGQKKISSGQVRRAFQAFELATLARENRSNINHNLVVVSQAGFTISAHKIAETMAVTCISLQELAQQVLEQEPYLRQMIAGGQSYDYVDLDISVGSDWENASRESVPFSSAIQTWLTSELQPLFWLTGKAGSGKTFSVTWLAQEFAKKWLDVPLESPTPVLICLQPHKTDFDIFELIAEEIGLNWRKETSRGIISSQIQNGHLLPVIDGLDVLAADEQMRVLYQIRELCMSGSPKIILTSRHGQDDPDLNSVIPGSVEFAVRAELQDLSARNIQHLLDRDEGDSRISHYFEKSNLFSNFRTPLLVRLIEATEFESDFTRSGINSKVLEHVIRRFISREITNQTTNKIITFDYICELAISMHLSGKTDTGTSNSRLIMFEEYRTNEFHSALNSSPLFTKHRGSPLRFTFVHRSIVDLLLACSIIQGIDGQRARILTARPLNRECIDFILGYGIDDRQLAFWGTELEPHGRNLSIGLENLRSIRNALNFDTSLDYTSIRVRKIFLQNIRCFEDVNVSFEMQDNYAGMSLLIGNNGVGKSTISQCVSLCALGPDLASQMVSRPDELLSIGSERGVLKCEFEVLDRNGQSSAVVVGMEVLRGQKLFELIEHGPHSSDNFEAFLHDRLKSKSVGYFVAAYGPTRNLDLTGNPKLYTQGDAVLNRVESMFNARHALIDPESLRRIMMGDGSPFDQFSAPPILSSSVSRPVANVLMSLLPSDELIKFSEDGKLVGEFGALEFSQLSDGYRSTLAWAGHLVVNLLQFVEWRSDITRVSGIVMVDEIDLHLHPKWQRTIATRLREAFPRIQFILSSHSPLVVADADGNEGRVMLLTRDGASVRIKDELPSFRGWRADQILASEAFDYLVDRDPKTEATLRELSILSGKDNRRSHEEEARYLELISLWSIERLVDGQTEIERQLQVDEFRSDEEEIRAKEKRIFGGMNDQD